MRIFGLMGLGALALAACGQRSDPPARAGAPAGSTRDRSVGEAPAPVGDLGLSQQRFGDVGLTYLWRD